MEKHPHIKLLEDCINLEIKEQEKRYTLDDSHSLKLLKSNGVALHPINVTRKSFGFADYPEISFKVPFPIESNSFKDNSPIECFIENESVKGILLSFDGFKGEFRLFAPDFPDWIEDKGIGIKLSPDHRTSEIMLKGLDKLNENKIIKKLFNQIHSNSPFGNKTENISNQLIFKNQKINESQRQAVQGIYQNDDLLIVHGPPGTGKTTTLIESILQLISKGEKVLVSTPSNAASDHIAKGLIENNVNLLRVGNINKINDTIYPFTIEGKLAQGKQQQEIKKLKIRAEELRKMANQYKRNFGRDKREQRKLLMQEVKNIRKEIRKLKEYYEDQLIEKADVIIGTPIGIYDFMRNPIEFDTLIIDEAGQCIEPLAWILFPYAKKWVLAGDHLQLPPTILSDEATKKGFNISILERAFKNCQSIYFLNTQYRMRKSIADFSSEYFYKSELKTALHLNDIDTHISFFDTAGTGYEETIGQEGFSLSNLGEMELVQKLIENEQLNHQNIGFISPYSAQVELAKENLPKGITISTIDSFQGQEKEVIIISLVRSNNDSTIGFLKDYRRMNVAITRAKEKLFVIGDSSTIGNDPFYAQFLEYMEKLNQYRSAWELMRLI